MKQNSWYSVLRKVCLVVGILCLAFLLPATLMFRYNIMDFRFPIRWNDEFVQAPHQFILHLSLVDWYIIRPLMMLCFGFCVITGNQVEKPPFSFKFDYILWFVLALVLFVPCAIACSYGIRYGIPEPRTFMEQVFREEWIRVTMLLASGIFAGLSCRALAYKKIK